MPRNRRNLGAGRSGEIARRSHGLQEAANARPDETRGAPSEAPLAALGRMQWRALVSTPATCAEPGRDPPFGSSRAAVPSLRGDRAPGVSGGDVTDTGAVALVAGATRGAGRAIAVELARAGVHVYATGRSSRTSGRSEIGPAGDDRGDRRPLAAVGHGTALVVDHEDPAPVAELVEDRARARVGSTSSSTTSSAATGTPSSTSRCGSTTWPGGLRMLQMGVDTHLITCARPSP